jgi:hypothetical protein
LDVGVRVSSTFGHRNDVIELEIRVRAALGTSAAILLPNPLTYIARNPAAGLPLVAGNDRLVRATDRRLPYRNRSLATFAKVVAASALSAATNLDATEKRVMGEDAAMIDLGWPV